MLSNIAKIQERLIKIEQNSVYYPQSLLCLATPPTELYALGNIELLKQRKFCIVGSRRTPSNALKLGEKIAEEISRAVVIITGSADGGDTAAIEGGLKTGNIISVLAGGFCNLPQGNLPLLERVADKGLLLSPYPFETQTRAYSYEYRNQLLAVLAEGVLVLGAGEKSGALITEKYARAQQKMTFALPYPPNSAAGVGCNAVIKQGGFLTENSQDIACRLGLDLSQNQKKITLSQDEEKMYSALQELIEGHINELAEKSGISPFKARAVLSSLEIKGLASSLGGNRYSVV